MPTTKDPARVRGLLLKIRSQGPLVETAEDGDRDEADDRAPKGPEPQDSEDEDGESPRPQVRDRSVRRRRGAPTYG